MRWILRFRVFIIICLAVALISAAVIFSVMRAVLPYATGYKIEIQQEISSQIGLPVEIESIAAAIHWFSPRLKLIGVSVFDEKNKVPLFNFKEAFVELDVIASLMYRDFIVADVGLVGADISIEKLSENEWSVQGIKISSEGSSELPEQFVYMLQNSDYLLHDSNIYYQDHTGKKLNLSLLDVNMDVQNNFNNHKIKFSMKLPEAYGKNLVVVADLQGEIDSLDGEVYVEAQQLKVKQWNKKFSLLQQYDIDAVLDINLWATLDDNDIHTLIAQLAAQDLSIRNVATKKLWKTKYLATDFRYQKDAQNWNITLADFYFGSKSKASWGRSATILASSDDESYFLSADFLRTTDLQTIADVLLTTELRKENAAALEKLTAYQLKADVYNLNLQVPKEMSQQNLRDKLLLQTSISDLSLTDSSNGIRLAGFDAAVQYEQDHLIVDLQTKDAEVEVKDMLRQPVFAEILQGVLTIDLVDDNWQLKTSQLQLKNKHINSFSRLDLQLTGDNIFVDAQTDFYDAYGKYATHYLPVGIMTPSLIDWLDMAVTSGYVPDGTFILYGNISDFPYQNKDGVFQVLFSPQDIDMRFMEGWPLLTGASGTVKFNNLSLMVTDAKARTHDVEMFNGYAEFLDLTKPHLTVKTGAHGKNEQVQSYVWNSPLDDILGDSLRLFQFEGNNDLSLTLEVPLDKDEIEIAIDGHLTFIDTAIYYPALGYDVSAINGVVDFTKDTVFADSINASIDNKPVSISAFTEDGDKGQQVVFHLDGNVDVDYLLQRYQRIPESWLSGDALWSMNFEVPNEPEDYLVHITANSQLEGVRVNMSDKVQKLAATKMAFTTEINVLDSSDLQVNARLGGSALVNNSAGDGSSAEIKTDDIVDLFAVRSGEKVWSFDLKSAYMTGKGEFTEGLGKDTQLKLDLDEIDVHSLFVSENNKDSQPLKPSDFPPLRWKAKKVLWDEWLLTDVQVETDWHKHGMLINNISLNGPAMAFDARGTWLTAWNGTHETVMQGNLSSSNCGTTLVGLGYQRSLDRCGYESTFNTKWPAEPYALSWATMQGKTAFTMNDGEILEVDPGAGGRLLGLLNIFKLANRLAFDFDDVTRKGFSFDAIKGDFEFVNGNGYLKNFDVSAPAADINMFGSIGMVKHDYGLLMRVKPHTDTLTFAGGALLGGVVVGAGLALIQKVFDLGIIGHNVYSITGTWDEPIIEKIVERTQDVDEDDDF